MKNKAVASVILVAAIMLLFMGNFIGNINFSIGNIHFGADRPSSNPMGNQTYYASDQKLINVYEEFDNIEQVELNLIRGNLKIVTGEKVSIKGSNINENCFSYTDNDKKLIVEEKNSSIFSGNASYILTVPSDIPLLKITANCSSGTIKFDDVSANQVSFNVEKGSLEGFDLVVSELSVDAGMGSVNLHNIQSQNINISSGMGSVNMDCKIDGDNGDLRVDSPMGSVNLRLNNNPADFYFDLASRSSSVNIDGVKATNYKYYNNDVNASKYGLIIGSGVSSVEICFDNNGTLE